MLKKAGNNKHTRTCTACFIIRCGTCREEVECCRWYSIRHLGHINTRINLPHRDKEDRRMPGMPWHDHLQDLARANQQGQLKKIITTPLTFSLSCWLFSSAQRMWKGPGHREFHGKEGHEMSVLPQQNKLKSSWFYFQSFRVSTGAVRCCQCWPRYTVRVFCYY